MKPGHWLEVDVFPLAVTVRLGRDAVEEPVAIGTVRLVAKGSSRLVRTLTAHLRREAAENRTPQPSGRLSTLEGDQGDQEVFHDFEKLSAAFALAKE